MWRSTEIQENTVELTFSDAAQTDDASTLLIVRTPFEADEGRSLASFRLQALRQARDIIGEEMKRLAPIVNASDRY